MTPLFQKVCTYSAVALVLYATVTGIKRNSEIIDGNTANISYVKDAEKSLANVGHVSIDYKKPISSLSDIVKKFTQAKKNLEDKKRLNNIMSILSLSRTKEISDINAPISLCKTKVMIDVRGTDSDSKEFYKISGMKITPGSIDPSVFKLFKDAALLARTGEVVLVNIPNVYTFRDSLVNIKEYKAVTGKSGTLQITIGKFVNSPSLIVNKSEPEIDLLKLKRGLANSKFCLSKGKVLYDIFSKSYKITNGPIYSVFDFMGYPEDHRLYQIFEYISLRNSGKKNAFQNIKYSNHKSKASTYGFKARIPKSWVKSEVPSRDFSKIAKDEKYIEIRGNIKG